MCARLRAFEKRVGVRLAPVVPTPADLTNRVTVIARVEPIGTAFNCFRVVSARASIGDATIKRSPKPYAFRGRVR